MIDHIHALAMLCKDTVTPPRFERDSDSIVPSYSISAQAVQEKFTSESSYLSHPQHSLLGQDSTTMRMYDNDA